MEGQPRGEQPGHWGRRGRSAAVIAAWEDQNCDNIQKGPEGPSLERMVRKGLRDVGRGCEGREGE